MANDTVNQRKFQILRKSLKHGVRWKTAGQHWLHTEPTTIDPLGLLLPMKVPIVPTYIDMWLSILVSLCCISICVINVQNTGITIQTDLHYKAPLNCLCIFMYKIV